MENEFFISSRNFYHLISILKNSETLKKFQREAFENIKKKEKKFSMKKLIFLQFQKFLSPYQHTKRILENSDFTKNFFSSFRNFFRFSILELIKKIPYHPYHFQSVSHHELIPITAPVIPMESCIKPFLEGCDANNDGNISIKEWGKCLGLKEGEIQERC